VARAGARPDLGDCLALIGAEACRESLIYEVALPPEAMTYLITIFGFGIACSMIYVAIQRNEEIPSFFKDRWSRWSVERVAM